MNASEKRIHLGAGGLAYAMTTSLILAVAMYTQVNLLFAAFGIMLGSLIVSGIWSWWTLRAVTVERLSPSHGVVDEQMSLRYYLTNGSRLPAFSVVVTETWGPGQRGWKKHGPIAQWPYRLKGRPYGWVLHLGPRQRIQAEAPCWPRHRGHLRLEKIVVSSGFPFGLIRKSIIIEQVDDVLIFPKLYRVNRHVLSRVARAEPMGDKQIQRGGGAEEFFGLRDYRAGDSLRLIDWKHSARTGRMIAREMTLPSPPRRMVLLDLHDSGSGAGIATAKRRSRRRRKKDAPLSLSELQERAISLAASLICDGYLKGYQVGLAVAGPPVPIFPTHHSLPHRTRLLTVLAELDLREPFTSLQPLPMPVTVEIHLRPAGPAECGGEDHLLSASAMENYVGTVTDVVQTLSSRAPTKSKRQALAEREQMLTTE